MANHMDVGDLVVIVANAGDQLVDGHQPLLGQTCGMGFAKRKQGVASKGKTLWHRTCFGNRGDGWSDRCSGLRLLTFTGCGDTRNGVHLHACCGQFLQGLRRRHGFENRAACLFINRKVLILRSLQAACCQGVLGVFGRASNLELPSADFDRAGFKAQLAVPPRNQRGMVLAIDKHPCGSFQADAVI